MKCDCTTETRFKLNIKKNKRDQRSYTTHATAQTIPGLVSEDVAKQLQVRLLGLATGPTGPHWRP